MSLDRLSSRKRKIVSPAPQESQQPDDKNAPDLATGQNPNQDGAAGVSPPIGTPATISPEKFEGIKRMVEAMRESGSGKGFSMNEVLSMDSETRSMPDVLAIPIGGAEHDVYRMLERTRLTNYQKGLYCDGIHLATHGFGWKETFPNGEEINLDFPIPILADSIVSRLRAAVSVDGQSLEVFERTMSNWTRYLYEKDQQAQLQQRRGIQQ